MATVELGDLQISQGGKVYTGTVTIPDEKKGAAETVKALEARRNQILNNRAKREQEAEASANRFLFFRASAGDEEAQKQLVAKSEKPETPKSEPEAPKVPTSESKETGSSDQTSENDNGAGAGAGAGTGADATGTGAETDKGKNPPGPVTSTATKTPAATTTAATQNTGAGAGTVKSQ